jgi:protein-disulfide isomerase
MVNEMDDKITLNKTTLYHGVIGVLVILLVVSVVTSGFGIITNPTVTVSIPTPTVPQPSPAVPTPNPSAAPAPAAISISSLMDDDVKLGSDSAPIVLIEFSDFQCPFCRKWHKESFNSLETEYIKTGKVQLVYRDFPLSFHPGAQKSAEAAECAREQNKWREMYDKINAEQEKQGPGTAQFGGDWSSSLKTWASQIAGIDTTKFNQCLDSGKYTSEVQDDLNDGTSVGVSGTPAFVIGKRGGNGQLIVGAQPYSTFKQAIDALSN